MTNLHYEFTGETTVNRVGLTLHRIRATRDLPNFGVKTGDVGGWIEKESNLQGNAWIADEAMVSGGAEVYGNAKVSGEAHVSSNAKVFGNAEVFGTAKVFGTARVFDNALVFGTARVFGNAQVFDSSEVSNDAHIESNADYFHAVTYTSTPLLLTLTRQKDGKHLIRMGCWLGTVDELETLIKGDKWVETSGDDADKARPEMLALCQMLRARIERWGNE